MGIHLPSAALFALIFFFLTASSESALALHLLNRERAEILPLRLAERVATRRRLAGLGSSPPNCRFKCGECSPCKAVHVAIEPATRVVLLEYYPEAWRCKCGSKLFMP